MRNNGKQSRSNGNGFGHTGCIPRHGQIIAAILLLGVISFLCMPTSAQDNGVEQVFAPTGSTPETPAATSDTSAAEEAPAKEDVAAQTFMRKCAGCHTIGAGQLTGPDLKTASGWPVKNAEDAVKRMEKNVGPLTEEDVSLFVSFIKSPDAPERIAREREQMALRMMAQLEPASASAGAALFHGRRAFLNGGLACASCHRAGGQGGTLAVKLEDAFTRIGEMPLVATCESPGYPLMRAIYADTPLTKQEAVHVVKYLESVAEAPSSARALPLQMAGFLAAGLLFAGVGSLGRVGAQGVRARLVSEARKNSKQGLA